VLSKACVKIQKIVLYAPLKFCKAFEVFA